MSRSRLLFRTRAGGHYGWGNLVRLATFADYCRLQNQCEILFILQGPHEVTTFLNDRGLPFVLLDESATIREEESLLSAYESFDVAFMEMLDCGPEQQAVLAAYAQKVVVFDDLLDHEYHCDIVVCGQALPGYGNTHLSSKKTKFFLGLDFFLIDSSTFKIKSENSFTSELKHILVCLGGGAYDVALLKTAHALALCPELKPTIVLGFAQSNLEKRLKKILPKAEIIAKGVNIPSFLVNFDLAIVSAGYLKIECAIAGIPAIMISTQWHQIPLAEEFSRLSHMPHIGYMGFFKPKELADLIHSFQEIKKRKQNAAHAQTLIDGKGMDRVYQTVFEKERNL